MPSPFPGMDPYLENPVGWRDVHHAILGELRAHLNARIRPRYVTRVEEHVYVVPAADPAQSFLRWPDVQIVRNRRKVRPARTQRSGGGTLVAATPVEFSTAVADAEVCEYGLKIVEVDSRKPVTVIELVSPTNKVAGSAGRAEYVRKRDEVMASATHWVEIDLLRMKPSVVDGWLPPCDYVVHVSRANRRPISEGWTANLRDQLPVVAIPLLGPGESVPVDLQSVLADAYERAAYADSLDYTVEPVPPLSPSDARWADTLLRKAGLRHASKRR